ncbi:MAG: hypothetical protein KIT84_05765 [Labilithrix sp.]|nr:hypothetical protein [Labilithrix sp.]MCW5810496.1 hypothetical protein [Labilithrix sp.]
MTAPTPRHVLAGFCALLLVGALLHRGHSVESLDVRTYVQMMRGVADHGLPYWDNGPLDRWPLVVPHAAPARGMVWGIYSPLYPYLLAPVLKAFGLARVSSATFALLVPIVLATFALAKRFVKNEWYAVGAAALVVVSTPLPGKSLEMTAFPLAVLMATLGTYFGVRVVAGDSSPRTGALAGLAWAAATAAHVLTFPMAAASLAVIAVAPAPDGGRSLRAAARRVGPAFAGFVGGLAPVCLLNRVRFSSLNPISYGPPPWCGPAEMNLASQVKYGIPIGVFTLVVVALLVVVRKKRFAWIGVLAAALAVAWLQPTLHEKGARYLGIGFGYLVDVGFFDLDPWMYVREEDKLGLLIGGWTNKATLQATPLVALAVLSFRAARRELRWPLAALLLPTVGLYASFLTRANMPYTHAFGFPWAYHRYTLPALPALLTAAFVVIERVRLPRAAFLAAAALGPLLAIYFWNVSDHVLLKRVILLVLTLAAALGAVVATLLVLRKEDDRRRARIAHVTIAAAMVLGIGIACGHDFRAHYEGKYWCDHWVDRFGEAVPRRFALIGNLGQFDVLLTTTATHDVRYVDIGHFPEWGHGLRELVDYWRAEGREVYLHAPFVVWHGVPASPWPDVTFVPTATVPDVLHLEFADVVPKAP